MKVMEVRLVVDDAVDILEIQDGLINNELGVHGVVLLRNDGFGHIIPDMDQAVTMDPQHTDVFDVREALSMGQTRETKAPQQWGPWGPEGRAGV